MRTDTLSVNNAKVGLIFADLDEATWDDGETSVVPGGLYKIVEICPSSPWNERPSIMAVCVNYDDGEDAEPQPFSLPFKCFVQAPFAATLEAA